MIGVEKLLKSLRSLKIFLRVTKFIPHLLALGYVIYTIFGLCGIDLIIMGSFIHVAILPWLYFFSNSIIYRYCYVHRLPLYYILVNEIITSTDYYINIPLSTFNLLVIHILAIACLIFSYSIYYVKTYKKHFNVVYK